MVGGWVRERWWIDRGEQYVKRWARHLRCTGFNDQEGIPITSCGATDCSCLCQFSARQPGAVWLSRPVAASSGSDVQADLLLMARSRCPTVNFIPFNSPLLTQQCLEAFRDYLNGEKKVKCTCLLGYMSLHLEPLRFNLRGNITSGKVRDKKDGSQSSFFKFRLTFFCCFFAFHWNPNSCLSMCAVVNFKVCVTACSQ